MTTRGTKRWQVIRDRVAAGRCRDCGKARGKGGTRDRCASCRAAANAYQRERFRRAFEALKATEER